MKLLCRLLGHNFRHVLLANWEGQGAALSCSRCDYYEWAEGSPGKNWLFHA